MLTRMIDLLRRLARLATTTSDEFEAGRRLSGPPERLTDQGGRDMALKLNKSIGSLLLVIWLISHRPDDLLSSAGRLARLAIVAIAAGVFIAVGR